MNPRQGIMQAYYYFSMWRIQSNAPGPGQDMADEIIDLAYTIYSLGNTIIARWVPGRRGVERNERGARASAESGFLDREQIDGMKNKSFPPKEKEQQEDNTRMDGDSEEETGEESAQVIGPHGQAGHQTPVTISIQTGRS